MNDYDRVNIQNGIIYFPLWRIKPIHYIPWTFEDRYINYIAVDTNDMWSHNCKLLGRMLIYDKYRFCPHCNANRLNEPTTNAILNYMDTEYEETTT